MSSHPAYGEVYSIQLYVIKFVDDLWQVGGFLRVKLTATMYVTEMLLKAVFTP